MQVLGCLFFLFTGVLLFVLIGVLAVVQKVLQAFGIQIPWFKFIKPGGFAPFTRQQAGNPQNDSHSSANKTKKLYTEEEGEYVDFEEVKDE